MTIFGFDLSNLGVAANSSGPSELFLSRGPSGSPDILGIAAVSLGSTSPSVVPVPASLPLLLAGLGGMAALRRRKARA